jgi:uncharacterized peroxidase-related enzyme
MSFIETTPPDQTTGQARAMLERQQRHYGYVPAYARVFADRPDVMDLWASLLAGIRRHVEPRRFELLTLAAALELKSSYCALAHGKVLHERFLSLEAMRALAAGDTRGFSEAEVAMMDLARKVVADASSVTQQDVDRLRQAGLRDDEIFDVVATSAARCFFAKLCDALGALPDPAFLELDDELRQRLTVGREISSEAPDRMAATPHGTAATGGVRVPARGASTP